MKVSRRWIDWAHGPGAEDGQPLAMSLCELASAPGVGAIDVADPALIAELVDVPGLYVSPCRGDLLHDMGTSGPNGAQQNGSKSAPAATLRPICQALRFSMRLSNHDPAAVAAAFERANAIVALDGFAPDSGYRAIQRCVIAGEMTSGQAVQLIIEKASRGSLLGGSPEHLKPSAFATLLAIVVPMDHVKT